MMCNKEQERSTALCPVEVDKLVQLSGNNRATAEQLAGMVQQMGLYLMQLDARMRKQEELLQQKITISHSQQKQLMAAMRKRATAICVKYRLPDEAAAMIRAAIKAEVLGRWRVKDLHDLPESVLGDALAEIDRWDSYSLVRKVREQLDNRDAGEVGVCRKRS